MLRDATSCSLNGRTHEPLTKPPTIVRKTKTMIERQEEVGLVQSRNQIVLRRKKICTAIVIDGFVIM